MSNWLSIPALSKELDISDNTVRRYIKRYPDFFKDSKTFDNTIKYPMKKLDILKRIYELTVVIKLKQTEIRGTLKVDFPEDFHYMPTPENERHDTYMTAPRQEGLEALGRKVDTLTLAVLKLSDIMEEHLLTIVDAIKTSEKKLSVTSDSTATPHQTSSVTLRDTMTPSIKDNLSPADTLTPSSHALDQTQGGSLSKPVTSDSTATPAHKKDVREVDSVTPSYPVDDRTRDIPFPAPAKSEVPFDRESIVARIIKMRDEEELSFEGIASKFNVEGLKTKTGKGGWHGALIGKWYKKAKANE